MDTRLPVGSYKTIQRPAALPGVEIMRGRAACGTGGGGYFTEYAVAAGDGPIRMHYRGKHYECAGRYVVLVEPGEFVPTYACGGDILFQTWCFQPEVMRQAAEDVGQTRSPRFAWGIAQDFRLHATIVSVTTTLARSRDALEQQTAMTELLDVLLSEHGDQKNSHTEAMASRAVRRMRELIHDGFDRPLGLDMLAEHAHLNKFHALRAFKRATGATPQQYQRHLRLSKSCEMLRAGRSCAEIAHELGFCDQSHFVRAFRHAHFITPHRYKIAGDVPLAVQL